jgi:glyoxylase-like metal-dependent hydrolase (beta-lactamase superfamily II)
MSDASRSPYDTAVFVDDNALHEVAPQTYYCTGFSGVTVFETNAGLVVVDTGLAGEAEAIADSVRERTDDAVHTAVYTHGHLDHAFGLEAYLVDGQDDPRVIGHEAMPARFERYERTAGHNEAINSRQFGGTATASPDEADESQFGWPTYPPTTLYQDELTITVGELTFEIHHGRGETDDHSWVYCPERDVLCTGDFVISAAPNAGNPQKVQRYPWEWADTLEQMAAVEPGTLCPGHGRPLINRPETIRERLLSGAEYLSTIVDRTLAALNHGSPPHTDIVHDVELPEPDQPWLAEVYDNGEFIVRNILRYYGGWWSGRPSELEPAQRRDLAEAVADAVGCPGQLAGKALELANAGDYQLACHFADFALEAAPTDDSIQDAVADVYAHRAAQATDLMAQNIYSAAAEYAKEGRPFR